MATCAPRYRYGFYAFNKDGDACGLALGIRRVDGDPDGGPFLQRTSSDGIGLDELLADLREMLSALPSASEPTRARVEPVRTWAFEGINGPFVMRETKTGRRLGSIAHEERRDGVLIGKAEETP